MGMVRGKGGKGSETMSEENYEQSTPLFPSMQGNYNEDMQQTDPQLVQLYRDNMAQKVLVFQNDILQIKKYVATKCQVMRLQQKTCIIPCSYKAVKYTMYRVFDHFFIALQDGLCVDPQKAFLVRYETEVLQIY